MVLRERKLWKLFAAHCPRHCRHCCHCHCRFALPALPVQDGVRFIGHLLSYDTIEAIEAFAILSDLFAAMRGGFDCGRTS